MHLELKSKHIIHDCGICSDDSSKKLQINIL